MEKHLSHLVILHNNLELLFLKDQMANHSLLALLPNGNLKDKQD